MGFVVIRVICFYKIIICLYIKKKKAAAFAADKIKGISRRIFFSYDRANFVYIEAATTLTI